MIEDNMVSIKFRKKRDTNVVLKLSLSCFAPAISLIPTIANPIEEKRIK
jgi:hypothetical protein